MYFNCKLKTYQFCLTLHPYNPSTPFSNLNTWYDTITVDRVNTSLKLFFIHGCMHRRRIFTKIKHVTINRCLLLKSQATTHKPRYPSYLNTSHVTNIICNLHCACIKHIWKHPQSAALSTIESRYQGHVTNFISELRMPLIRNHPQLPALSSHVTRSMFSHKSQRAWHRPVVVLARASIPIILYTVGIEDTCFSQPIRATCWINYSSARVTPF